MESSHLGTKLSTHRIFNQNVVITFVHVITVLYVRVYQVRSGPTISLKTRVLQGYEFPHTLLLRLRLLLCAIFLRTVRCLLLPKRAFCV